MSLMLGEMDNFVLEDLDRFFLQDLGSMSFKELVSEVGIKNHLVSKKSNQGQLLSDEQIQIIHETVRAYTKEEKASNMKTITIGVATQIIGTFLIWCAQVTSEHLPEIMELLKKIYILLGQLFNQIG